MDLFYFSIRAGCKDTSVRINNIWLFVISVPFLWCFRFLRFWAFWGCLIRLSFHLHLGLLIDLISSAGALYLQWYQCETCILLMIWLSGSVMFTCTDFCDSFCFLFCFVFLFCLLISLSFSLPPSLPLILVLTPSLHTEGKWDCVWIQLSPFHTEAYHVTEHLLSFTRSRFFTRHLLRFFFSFLDYSSASFYKMPR